jgi:hypothetical protein
MFWGDIIFSRSAGNISKKHAKKSYITPSFYFFYSGFKQKPFMNDLMIKKGTARDKMHP